MTKLGPYVLLDRIARGGMGEIFLASLRREGGFEKALAVKRILPHLADDDEFVRMFESEARLSALLNHPNIVHIYDFGKVDGEAYLAMELVDGFDLKTLMRLAAEDGTPIPLGHAVRIAAECARALEYAHQRRGPDGELLRLVHRDVSPQNILISMQGETKLTDFGLAKAMSLDTGSISGMLKGKLAYMAPEQMKGEPLDARTDVFATGAVLYEMVSGTRLYTPDLPVAELVANVTYATHEPIDAAAPDAPEPIRTIIARCLALKPEDRFPTAGGLERALHSASSGLGLTDTSYQMADYMRRFADRRQVIPGVQPDGTVISKKPIVKRDGSADPLADTRAGADHSLPSDSDATRVDSEAPVAEMTRIDDSPPPAEHRGGWGIPTITGVLVAAVVILAAWPDAEIAPAAPKHDPDQPPATVSARSAEAPAARHPRRTLDVPHNPAWLRIQVDGSDDARCFVIDLLRDTKRTVACGVKLELAEGPHRVAVMAEGFVTQTHQVVLRPGVPKDLSVTLESSVKITCVVALSTTPAGAAVVLDAAPVPGRTPLTLPALAAGSHTLALSKSGYVPKTAAVECTKDTPTELTLTLDEQKAVVQVGSSRRTLRIGSTFSKTVSLSGVRAKFRVRTSAKGANVRVGATPYAQVALDGKSRGETPVELRIAAGRTHTVSFSRDGRPVGRVALRVTLP